MAIFDRLRLSRSIFFVAPIVTLAFISGLSRSHAQSRPAPARPPIAAGDLCTGGDAAGSGLRGVYYGSSRAAADPVLIRVDAAIDAIAVSRMPAQLQAAHVQRVRWCGWIRPTVSGLFRFDANLPSVRIDIASKHIAGRGADSRLGVDLEAGKTYPIKIDMPVAADTHDFRFLWTPPFGVTYAVPPTVLFPPLETVAPGC